MKALNIETINSDIHKVTNNRDIHFAVQLYRLEINVLTSCKYGN